MTTEFTLSAKQLEALRLIAQTEPFKDATYLMGFVRYSPLGIAWQTKNSLVRLGLLQDRNALDYGVARWVQLTAHGRAYAIEQGWIAE